MRAAQLAVVVLAAAGTTVAKKFTRDVPLGECHQCEVTCFKDCAFKYNAEIIEPEQREYEHKQRMLRENGGGNLAARGLSGVKLDSFAQDANRTHTFAWRNPTGEKHEAKDARKQKELARINKFSTCLRRERCAYHPMKLKPEPASEQCLEFYEPGTAQTALVALRGSSRRPSELDPSCAMKCMAESETDAETAADQAMHEEAAEVEKEEEEALMQVADRKLKRDFPARPVMVGSFSRIGLTLDFCFKSCLAVTCGCSDAPGFEALDKMVDQVKGNLAAGAPVADTKPTWQYAPATLAECGKGMKKVTQQMYLYTGKSGDGDGGWVEICTQSMMNSMFGPAFPMTAEFLKRCKSHEADDKDFGCTWNDDKQQCLAGFVPVTVPCSVKTRMDITGPGIGAPPPVLTGDHLEGATEVMKLAHSLKDSPNGPRR